MPHALPLPRVSIPSFRGIATGTIPRLGRVMMLAGQNSVGRTMLREAVRIYASRGRYRELHELPGGSWIGFKRCSDEPVTAH